MMEDSTQAENTETATVSQDTAGEEAGDTACVLKHLKLQRGRKAAAFTRACNTAEAQIARRASEEELKKRLETLNATLDGFMEANDAYVEKVQEVCELEEAEEYATRLTARHAETVKRIEEATTHRPELREAEVETLRQVQETSYPEESRSLRLQQALPAKSDLLPLTPYCDELGLLRAGGRLGNAPVAEDARHPIILPRSAEVTRLVIMQEHVRCGHAGVEQTLNELWEELARIRGVEEDEALKKEVTEETRRLCQEFASRLLLGLDSRPNSGEDRLPGL
ncbi:hypothetical protein FJT64_025192 [Amphibalanus amphitrite]|uniref:Integrase zinc-binding domain-containing protein n=1 Tax=Amphibalanus amphitrite TaxID=1232801 RepID=A0A6A4WC20_AMPAM|nr:hypothetical protein FJT64_025192 [Amphibalanus amphitrite]